VHAQFPHDTYAGETAAIAQLSREGLVQALRDKAKLTNKCACCVLCVAWCAWLCWCMRPVPRQVHTHTNTCMVLLLRSC
jgi:hypothetical protein